ncbi:MAG: ATP-dependent DNA helicase RecG [Candidatus Doudnabacteria bacterium]|nr:ATP-dependent DNA helicase RecG [Candidatus Doudnabacteria bacterium]
MNLDTPVENLYLVGPARAKILKKLEISTLKDLLFYFPRAHQDLTKITFVKDLKVGEFFNIKAKVLEIKTFRTKVKKLSLTQALVEDESGSIICMWFNQPFLTKAIKPHEIFLFSGKVILEKNRLILQNPIYEREKAEQVHTARLVPIYSLTAQLTQKQLRTIIKTYLDKTPIPDYLPSDILKKERFMGQDQAVKTFHFPPDTAELKLAQNRLAFDEIFQNQVKVLQYKKLKQLKSAYKISPHPWPSLPFELTQSQEQSLADVLSDFGNPYPANRLLEGDVGSGKTIVAALAMWLVAKNGLQAVMLTPTEVLAQQHYQNLRDFFGEEGISAALRTSTHKMEIAKVTFGTHALLEKNIKFDKLALIVIDEQHRFGVEQRSILKQASNAHLLTLSATPIPRTLALTLYGDLDISVLSELPAGRLPIWTKIGTEENRPQAYEFIAKQIEAGRQVFVICPRIEEGDRLGIKSATAEYKKLAEETFPQFKIGLLHGKMKNSEKEKVMQAFKDNQINILVSTSVVEVGVDVPNATVMMIEGAERFGLAQLHQFRGRVSRSTHKSYCFLFTSDPENPRLKAVAENNNGFELAEKDLEIRGSGDLYGTAQSGYGFRIASLSNLKLVERSKQYAEKLLQDDLMLINHPLLAEKIKQLPTVHLE